MFDNYRFEQFEHENPNKTTSVCIVSALSNNGTQIDAYGCDTIIAPSVYLHTVYIGLACIPGSIILPIFVHKLGAKFFLSMYIIIYINIIYNSLNYIHAHSMNIIIINHFFLNFLWSSTILKWLFSNNTLHNLKVNIWKSMNFFRTFIKM